MNNDINTSNVIKTEVKEEDNENLALEEIEQIESTKKYTLEEILKSSSCVLSKEKIIFGKMFYFLKNFMIF